MGEWQPIETAPKDGAKIDLWVSFPDRGYRWPDASWGKADAFYGAENWMSQEGVPLHALLEKPIATHWMPLPEPPND